VNGIIVRSLPMHAVLYRVAARVWENTMTKHAGLPIHDFCLVSEFGHSVQRKVCSNPRYYGDPEIEPLRLPGIPESHAHLRLSLGNYCDGTPARCKVLQALDEWRNTALKPRHHQVLRLSEVQLLRLVRGGRG